MSQQALYMAEVLKDLHLKWMPHDTQKLILNAIFYQGKKKIGIECGRKWGKTEVICYVFWRFNLMMHNLETYYFGPTITQASELIWNNHRIQKFGPEHRIVGINETSHRIRFDTGSFLKIGGSENYEAYRGVGPDFYAYDEYKDFHPKFHPAMEPNEGAKAKRGMGIHLVVGTPPEIDAHPDDPSRSHPFIELMDEIKEDPDGAYFNFPTEANPHIDKKWLAKQKKKYEARGDAAGYAREYEARRVKGGPGAIFPMWDRRKFVFPHNKILEMIKNDRRHLLDLVIADPGTETVFGVLFMVVNPFKRTVYLLDEIYADKQSETSTSKIIKAVEPKRRELGFKEPMQVYDEAGAWFANEALDSFGESWHPTQKSLNKKTNGLSLIKDLMLESRLFVSDRLRKLIWEIENYVKDKNGNIPKDKDHLIDCFRYGNAAAGLSLEEENMPDSPEIEDTREDEAMKRRLRALEFDEWDEDV